MIFRRMPNMIVIAIGLFGMPGLLLQGATGPVRHIAPSGLALSRPLRSLSPVATAPAVSPASTRTGATLNTLNFNGTPEAAYVYPDANGAPGDTQYMQWTNARYSVYSKASGAKILGPVAAKLLWASLGGQCATTNAGDGIITFDKAAHRWIVTHHTAAGVPYLQCVAVSTSADATGSYFLYAFSLTLNYYPDYPQLGVWPDAYYLTANLLTPNGFGNVSAQVCALDRNSMLNGNPNATAQCTQTGTHAAYSVLQPADLDGATPPPPGSPNYLLAINVNSLDLYKFHVDWVNPANTNLSGPTNIPVQAFNQACGGGVCIPQLGTTQVLDGVGDRLLHRVAYRNTGNYDVLLVNHAVGSGSSVGVRWYEIRDPGSTPVVFQQGTQAPDANFRWLGSLGMDKIGNIAVGYSVSSAGMYPSIRYAGRQPFDPLGILETEVNVFTGSGAQTAGGNNWGNASSMAIDPVDDCTFWYTNEYMLKTGSLANTRINTFKFASCQ